MQLPSPSFASPVEDYAPRDPPTTCDPGAKPGVLLFRDFVVSSIGGGEGHIERPCSWGNPNHHHEGRAWDWMVSANDPADVARVELLLSWLFATDERGEPHAMLRRAGIDYIIWDRRIWNARNRVWEPYTGASPHTDHVHFSFSWPAARGETSLYDFLLYGPDEPAPTDPWWEPATEPSRMSAGALLAGLGAFAAGYLAVSTAMRASKGVGKRSAAARP